jgi:asparagine synthase (glutamine-hydrolysing)
VEYRAALLPDLLPAVVDHLEEPVTTAPAALEYMLSRLAGSHVKAVLSGEGADELFGGYWWYQRDRYYHWRRRIPAGLRRLMAPFLRAAAGGTRQIRWSRLLGFAAAGSDTAADVEWQRLFTAAERAALLRRRHRGPDLQPLHLEGSFGGHVDRLLATDILRRLPDGILLINDKQSMAHSLEVRMPFLDGAVIDFAAGLPGHYKVRNGREKYILSRLGHLLPAELAARRKHGLRYPKGTLFTGPLAAMARERFAAGSLLRPESALPLLKLAESGNGDAVRKMWTLLFLQLWWDRFLGSRAREEFQERYAVPAATGGRQ